MELLSERTDAMHSAQLAAYIDGWSSLLDLLRHSRLILPQAPDADHARLAELVERIRTVTAPALDDE